MVVNRREAHPWLDVLVVEKNDWVGGAAIIAASAPHASPYRTAAPADRAIQRRTAAYRMAIAKPCYKK